MSISTDRITDENVEAVHRVKQRDGGDPEDPDNIEFLTPNEHALRDRGDG